MTKPRKPPKPADRVATPRTKRKRPTEQMQESGIEAARRAVRTLSNEDMSEEDYKSYELEAGKESGDRGIAILLATNVENALQIAIRRWLQLSGRLRGELFKDDHSPFGSFSAKITVGEALGIFGLQTRQNLDSIRTIRNAFAHARRPIRFDNAALVRLCNYLEIPKIIKLGDFDGILNPEENPASPARYRFRVVCEHTSRNLIVHNHRGPLPIVAELLKKPLYSDDLEIFAREKSLP